jgi:hypothetical protein
MLLSFDISSSLCVTISLSQYYKILLGLISGVQEVIAKVKLPDGVKTEPEEVVQTPTAAAAATPKSAPSAPESEGRHLPSDIYRTKDGKYLVTMFL